MESIKLGNIYKQSKEVQYATWSRHWLWFLMHKDKYAEQYITEFVAILWSLWTQRNKIVFNKGNELHPSIIMEQIEMWKGK